MLIKKSNKNKNGYTVKIFKKDWINIGKRAGWIKKAFGGVEYVDLSSSPLDEPAVQVNPNVNYIPEMKAECRRFAEQLRTIFPWAIEHGIEFVIKGNPHDFGTYYEVFARVDANNDKSLDLAYWMQDNLPLTWEDLTPRPEPDLEIDNLNEENYHDN